MAAHVLKSLSPLAHPAWNSASVLYHGQARACRRFTKPVLQSPKRSFYRMLNAVFNKVDPDRIKEVGPNRACAEWLLRCGAFVKFRGVDKWTVDYNLLPAGAREKMVIEQVDASDSSIMHVGFPHFAGCNHIEFIKLHHCIYLDDESLSALDLLKDSLTRLQLSSTGNVTNKGFDAIKKLHNLKTLFLYDLPEVKDIENAIKTLNKDLPQCEIKYLSTEDMEAMKQEKEAKDAPEG